MRLETACEEAEVSSERDGERERHLKKELFKIQQQEERTYSKSSKRERGLIQNPARERERTYSKSSKREKAERARACARCTGQSSCNKLRSCCVSEALKTVYLPCMCAPRCLRAREGLRRC